MPIERSNRPKHENEPQQPPLEVKLGTHPALQQIARRIEATPLTFDLLLRKLEQARFPKREKLSKEYLKGLLLEYHLDYTLFVAASYDPRIMLNPVKHNESTSNYRFNVTSVGRQHLQAVDRQTNQLASEYDSVLLIDDPNQQIQIPTLIETKILSDAPKAKQRFRQDLQNSTINKKFRPIQERFPKTSQFAYAIATLPEVINPQSRYQQELIRQGGLIIPFGFSRQEFNEQFEEWF